MTFPIRPTHLRSQDFDPALADTDFFYGEGGARDYPDHHCKLTYEIALPFLLSFRNAVDVGCRDGEFTRYLQRSFRHVYCFDPRMRKKFARHVDVSRVTHFVCALGDEACEIEMYGGTHDPRWKPQGAKVRCLPLDSFHLQEIDFIKIDVEGFERKVLAGAEQLISRDRPVVVIEQNEVTLPGEEPKAAQRWLEARGYRLAATCSRGWDHIMIPN